MKELGALAAIVTLALAAVWIDHKSRLSQLRARSS